MSTTSPGFQSRTLLFVVAVVLVATGCSSSGSEGADGDALADTAIEWSACEAASDDSVDDQQAFEFALEGFECATVVVPVDYDDPEKGTLDLYVSRRPAPADDPIGPLFVNQGGPGIEAAFYASTIAVNPRLDRFDIVGMDPRGTGRSTHLDCGDVEFDWATPVVPAADDPETPFEQGAHEFAQACEDDPLLPFLGTNSAARDMDHLRDLLGSEQISYLGKSYGSDLGAAYAALFPESVRVAVLDGATDLTRDLTAITMSQRAASDARFERYLEHCRVDECAWTESQEPSDAWSALLARAEAGAIVDADTGTVVDRNDLTSWRYGVTVDSEDDDIDFELGELVFEGDLEAFVPEPVEPGDETHELMVANVAITCLDTPVDDFRASAAQVAKGSEEGTESLDILALCASWPASDPIGINSAAGAGPILVTATTGDVPTPYESSLAMASVLDTSGTIEWDADVHTAYTLSPCIGAVVDQFLVDTLLPPDVRCDDPIMWWSGVEEPDDFYLDLPDS